MIRSSHIALLSRTLAFALAVPLASFGAVALSPRTAMAQDQAAVDKLVQMNKKALDDYDTLDWDAAKRILLDALVAGKKAGLDNHPVMGRTYIHLGAVYITGFKDRQKGLQSFRARWKSIRRSSCRRGSRRRRSRRRSPRPSAARAAVVAPRPAVGGAMTTTRRRPRRSAAARSWRGMSARTITRSRRSTTRAATRSPICRPTSARSTVRSRTRRSSTSRSPSAAWWPPACRWPAST